VASFSLASHIEYSIKNSDNSWTDCRCSFWRRTTESTKCVYKLASVCSRLLVCKSTTHGRKVNKLHKLPTRSGNSTGWKKRSPKKDPRQVSDFHRSVSKGHCLSQFVVKKSLSTTTTTTGQTTIEQVSKEMNGWRQEFEGNRMAKRVSHKWTTTSAGLTWNLNRRQRIPPSRTVSGGCEGWWLDHISNALTKPNLLCYNNKIKNINKKIADSHIFIRAWTITA